ncbi:methyl-accepting chemotaxis protein [Sneathiella limimaris]|uniref:methyl-accepting chemotaxis protein n=1 Tax=Sneathiella limimaris TaxID=1964213 RepID=UPI00146D0480|nr:methyl-accepting chemotaxis protein [Sneathiella limimaris]
MSIQKKLIYLIAALLAATIIIAGTTSYLQVRSLVSDRLYGSELPANVVAIRNQIEKRLGVYLTASQGIASNTYVLDWFAKGEPEEGIKDWAAYASRLVNSVDAFSATFASNVTRKYYDQNGFNQAGSDNMKYWFDGFIQSGAPYEMVLDKSDSTGNEWKLFTNIRVDVGGKLASVGLGVDAKAIAQEIEAIKVGETGYVWLTAADGTYKLHRDQSLIGERNIKDAQGINEVAAVLLTGKAGEVKLDHYSGPNGEMIVGAAWIPTIQSFVFIEIPASEVFGEINTSMLLVLAIVLVILGIAIYVATVIARQISEPIMEVTGVVGELAEGNTDVAVPSQEREDEVGAIAKAIEVFRVGIIEQREKEEAQRQAEEKARLEKQETEERAREEKRLAELQNQENQRRLLNEMADNFEASVGGVVEAVSVASGKLNSTTEIMNQTAETSRGRATSVAAASEEVSRNVQTVSAATEELTASGNEISHQVNQSTAVARNAVQQASVSKGNIDSLVEASHKIGEVVNIITDIAEQTNLLALNATIEAARAGDAGKGFAVVASEVKNLANQTAKATEDISNQIAGIQSSTEEAALSIESVSTTIHQIEEIASSVAAAVEEQTAATKEIARNVEQAAAGTREVSSNISGVTDASHEVEQVSSTVLEAVRELDGSTGDLKREVSRFLNQVRGTG